MHCLAADQNIERTGVENDPTLGCEHWLPELRLRVMADKIEVNQPRVRLGAIPDDVTFTRRQIDGKP